MHILHLDSGREMRGGQLQVVRLIEGLLAAGVDCTLLARQGSPLTLEARRRGWKAGRMSPLRVWTEARRHDLVHAHDARSHTVAALVRCPRLIVARRVAFDVGSRWKYRSAVRYIAVSDFVRSILIEGGVTRDRISVVGDGVPRLPLSDWTGGAVAPDNAADPAKGAAIAHQAAQLADAPIAFSRDLERDLAHAAMFVYLTHSEGLGSAVLLAMSAGVPVIASAVGGLPEIVVHRETGMLVENAPQSVAGAMRILMDQRDLARTMAGRARRMVQERFTVDTMVRATMEVYRQVLQ
jgi:hypothetical protein